MASLVALWKRDIARNTFYFTSFLNGIILTLFATYANSQLQTTGVSIGTGSNGGPCTVDCSVLMGTQRLDIQQVLLYLTALTLGLGGLVALSLAWFADLWSEKSLLVTGCSAIYCAFAIPVYWLTDPSESDFSSLFALSTIFGIGTTVWMSIIGVYIPYCMRMIRSGNSASAIQKSSVDSDGSEDILRAQEARNHGFAMSTLGMAFDSGAGLLASAVVTALSNTVSASSAQNVGNLLTTIAGFLTLAGSAACYFGLPTLPARKWTGSASEFIFPVRCLFGRRNAVLLLLSYTVYTAVAFALYSNLFQVFAVVVEPSALEFSLFSLSSGFWSWLSYVLYFLIRRRFQFNLERCLLFGYALTLVVSVWSTIGISDQDGFGDKHRWEFYVQLVIYQVCGAIVNSTWRVLYAELIPNGEEFLWFGMQAVLFCATNWINPVATGSLQAQTSLRFPMVMCAIFGAMAVAIEAFRMYFPSRQDKRLYVPRESGQMDADGSQLADSSLAEKKLARLETSSFD